LLRLRIEFLLVGDEYDVSSCQAQLLAIFIQGAWIAVEVAPRFELQAIYKNAHHYAGTVLLSDLQQAQMSGVQIAHRGDEGDRFLRGKARA
jgi:hypothetical protein